MILSLSLCLKEAMESLGNEKKVVPLSGFEMVAYRMQVSKMTMHLICCFQAVLSYQWKSFHLCLSYFHKIPAKISEHVDRLTLVAMRG